jgi:DNA polymerase III sliding clamp (beta) subunit (PCNA family)
MHEKETKVIKLSVNSLKAAAKIAAKKDIRYYLIGVHVRVDNEGLVYIESCDGVMAFQDRMKEKLDDNKGVSIIIPLSVIESVLKTIPKKTDYVDLLIGGDGRFQLGDTLFKAVEGKYPPVDRVMPARNDADEERALWDYDFEQLARCESAMRHATGRKYFKLQHGKCGLMHLHTNEVYPRVCVMALGPNAFR